MSMPENNYLAGIATAAAVAMMALLMPSQGQAQTDPRVQKSMELLKSMTAKLGAKEPNRLAERTPQRCTSEARN
jgi:hypothetical protein